MTEIVPGQEITWRHRLVAAIARALRVDIYFNPRVTIWDFSGLFREKEAEPGDRANVH